MQLSERGCRTWNYFTIAPWVVISNKQSLELRFFILVSDIHSDQVKNIGCTKISSRGVVKKHGREEIKPHSLKPFHLIQGGLFDLFH